MVARALLVLHEFLQGDELLLHAVEALFPECRDTGFVLLLSVDDIGFFEEFGKEGGVKSTD